MEGINDSGQAVGQWTDAKGNTHSFLFDIATGTFTDIKVPGATNVQAWAINNGGEVVLDSDAGAFIWCAKKNQCPTGGAVAATP